MSVKIVLARGSLSRALSQPANKPFLFALQDARFSLSRKILDETRRGLPGFRYH